ncbi:MAG TPA: response regulator, partial [Gemmatimonadaceae bacterium]|nr:response regulator [Gemmatimonadaceae bacterium]
GADARTAIWSRATANLAPDVIIVDDDHALTEMLQFAMRSSGLTNRAFDNGRAALEAILAMHTLGRRPLVLLDVDLPGIDGYTLHERLRVERPGAFQVVFLTVHSAEAEQIRALRAGALDYIVKPLNLRILMAKVPLWVGRMPP